MKIVTTAGGATLYRHTILINKETQTLLERLHAQRKKETGGCTFSNSLNHVISEYIRLWELVEKENQRK